MLETNVNELVAEKKRKENRTKLQQQLQQQLQLIEKSQTNRTGKKKQQQQPDWKKKKRDRSELSEAKRLDVDSLLQSNLPVRISSFGLRKTPKSEGSLWQIYQ